MLEMVQGHMILMAIMTAFPVVIWIGSIQVEYPKRLALIWIAIFFGMSSLRTGDLSSLEAKHE